MNFSIASVWLVLFQNTVLSDLAYSSTTLPSEQPNFYKRHISFLTGIYLCVGKTASYIAYSISYPLGRYFSSNATIVEKFCLQDPFDVNVSSASFFISFYTVIALILLLFFEFFWTRKDSSRQETNYYALVPTESCTDLLLASSNEEPDKISTEIDYFPSVENLEELSRIDRRGFIQVTLQTLCQFPVIFWGILWVSFWMTGFWTTFLEISPEWYDLQYGSNYDGFLWKKGLNSLLFSIFLSLAFGKWIDFCPCPLLFLFISCLSGMLSIMFIAIWSLNIHYIFGMLLFSLSLSSGQVALAAFLTKYIPNPNIGTAYAFYKSTLNCSAALFNVLVGFLMDSDRERSFQKVSWLFISLPGMAILPFIIFSILNLSCFFSWKKSPSTLGFRVLLILFLCQLLASWIAFFLGKLATH